MSGKVKSINISGKRGVRKLPVLRVLLRKGLGIEGDVHASPGDRQVSLLSWERIKEQGLNPGDFAENITTEGIDLTGLKLNDLLRIGGVRLRISKIGKKCHTRCGIFERLGDCIMPREGIFAEVLVGGTIRVGDVVEISSDFRLKTTEVLRH